jgi:hypothetical protein
VRVRKKVADRIKSFGGEFFIVDPIYKTYLGVEENNNSMMALMFNYWTEICMRTGSGCVTADHFAKGEQSGKAHLDRIVGAGAKTRHGDNLITLTASTVRKREALLGVDTSESKYEEQDFYLVEITNRDMKRPKPFIVEWIWPMFKLRPDLEATGIKSSKPKSEKQASGETHRKYNNDLLLRPLENLTAGLLAEDWFDKVSQISPMARATFYNRIKELVYNGKVKKEGTIYKLV